MSTTKKGKFGEKMAAEYLKKKEYIILEMNYRYRRGEIDIIASKSQLLVFVEVKMNKNVNYGFPEDAVDAHKKEMIITTADHYIFENDWQGPIRFDIISISETGDRQEILHIEDAFY